MSQFKKYNLSNIHLVKIAMLCKQEQGTLEGAKAEASLAANILETNARYKKKFGSDLYLFMRNSGWFYKAAYYMDNGDIPTPAYLDAIIDVLCLGNRTLPLGVDEHDCLLDILTVSNDGVEFDKKDRSKYIKGKTRIKNRFSSEYTFYCFPSAGSDPFGYTDANAKYMEEVNLGNVIIGSARIDENGKAVGGNAGDQTGKEVSTQEWYLHIKGWYVIRPKRKDVAEKIAYAMQAACDNPNIGYDQNQRYTAYDWCKYNNNGNFDPAKITVKVEVDCSALVRLCLAYAGIFVGDFYTGNQFEVLMATDAFIDASGKAGRNQDYLMRGDILVTKSTGHTVVVLTNGALINEAINSSADTKVVIDNGVATYKLRTIEIVNGKELSGGDVLLVQEILNAKGYVGRDGKPLVLDGQTGSNYNTSNTMFAIGKYIDDRKAAGVNLGGRTGWGPKCWADQNLMKVEE